MSDHTSTSRQRVTLAPPVLQQMIDVLRADGYRVIGPVVGNGAIVYDDLASTDQLPAGQTERQQPGLYRLMPREDQAWFGFTVGAHSLKRFLYPPVTRLWRAEKTNAGFTLVPEVEMPSPMAFIGVRACEIAAARILDTVLMGGAHVDPLYKQLRERSLVVAVNCGMAASTCFCASMGTGPKVESGFDVALTEVVRGDVHYFVAEAGSERGRTLLARLTTTPATPEQLACANEVVEQAAREMGRTVNIDGLSARMAVCVDHPRWEAVARRCLTCANCTLVCPTCFCATIEDETDLTGAHASRVRKWDSCFTLDFSYIHGGSVRPSPYARYRQWLMHKFGTWKEQFGTYGCVGCGRCITWCPVGIDVTEEVRAVAGSAVETPVETV